MLHYRVRNQNQGFTLIEMIVVTVIVGIVGAIAIPSFFGLLNRNRSNQAIAEIEGALTEAQKRATRNSRSCTISINAATNTISNNTPADTCLLTTRNINTDLTMNTSRPTITFSGKGNVSLEPQTPVIVVSFANGSLNQQRCVVIQNTLGSIRTGDYSETIPTKPVPGSCQ